ncbi:hypothetical protein RHSIM_Rhsim02G0005000 [Rhododendron simsii]|uniref:Uncharacterized protein n=1 Tax=Rhododendron simsii TaxID=118357 RepID=A0A834HPM0_RHOSS|nr:hypothetical protein RHSIM_Rhsim02G0005000 [Rhododendron simsii]
MRWFLCRPTVVVGWVVGVKPFENDVTETLGTMSNTLVKILVDVEEIKKAGKAVTDDVATNRRAASGGKTFVLWLLLWKTFLRVT